MINDVEQTNGTRASTRAASGDCHFAKLEIICHIEPIGGPVYVELRRWSTLDGTAVELVAEFGLVGDDGELRTEAHVLPFHWDFRDAVMWLAERIDDPA